VDRLKDLSTVVTGGTRGFGRAMAEAFLAEGARVMICGRDKESTNKALEALRTQLGSSSADRVDGLTCDVAEREQVESLAEQTLSRFDRIDVWVNNAAISGPYGQIETIPQAEFEAVVRTNILGCYHGTYAALTRMLPIGRGKIINIAGLGANGRPAPFQSPYCASKAWVQSFTRSVAAEHEDSGVGVFALSPGMMITDMVTKVRTTSGEGCRRLEHLPIALRMIAQPPQIPARRAVWLASSATDGKTGLVVRVLTPTRVIALIAADLARRATGREKEIPSIDVNGPT